MSTDPIQTSESLICAVAAVAEARKARRKTIWRMGGSYRGMEAIPCGESRLIGRKMAAGAISVAR
jgi:hypothetical protein